MESHDKGQTVKLVGGPSSITVEGDAWILHVPRFGEEGTHYHTYGLLTPYFKALAEGRLLGPGPIRIGDKVRAHFRTGPAATHTCLDLYWALE